VVWEDIFDKKSSISMEFVKSLRSGLWRSKVGMQIKQRKKDDPNLHSPDKSLQNFLSITIPVIWWLTFKSLSLKLRII